MIEKFNFYDIYGYFLPGLSLLGILWLPFGLVKRSWPAKDWGSAIIVLALAYVLGQFLQTFGATALKSKIAPNNRFPSDAALDAGSMPETMRTKIAEIFQRRFGMDLRVDQPASKEIDAMRNHAFFLARSVLNREKTGSYAEQYQGMYALTRGLVVALVWGVAYWVGWAASIYRTRSAALWAAFGIIMTLSLLASLTLWLSQESITKTQRWRMERVSLFALMPLALLTVGYIVGLRYGLTLRDCSVLLLASAAGFAACVRFYSAHKTFAWSFATAVWRDFLALNVYLEDQGSSSRSTPNPSAVP